MKERIYKLYKAEEKMIIIVGTEEVVNYYRNIFSHNFEEEYILELEESKDIDEFTTIIKNKYIDNEVLIPIFDSIYLEYLEIIQEEFYNLQKQDFTEILYSDAMSIPVGCTLQYKLKVVLNKSLFQEFVNSKENIQDMYSKLVPEDKMYIHNSENELSEYDELSPYAIRVLYRIYQMCNPNHKKISYIHDLLPQSIINYMVNKTIKELHVEDNLYEYIIIYDTRTHMNGNEIISYIEDFYRIPKDTNLQYSHLTVGEHTDITTIPSIPIYRFLREIKSEDNIKLIDCNISDNDVEEMILKSLNNNFSSKTLILFKLKSLLDVYISYIVNHITKKADSILLTKLSDIKDLNEVLNSDIVLYSAIKRMSTVYTYNELYDIYENIITRVDPTLSKLYYSEEQENPYVYLDELSSILQEYL